MTSTNYSTNPGTSDIFGSTLSKRSQQEELLSPCSSPKRSSEIYKKLINEVKIARKSLGDSEYIETSQFMQIIADLKKKMQLIGEQSHNVPYPLK